jgi:archaeoflavoprotein AfpA
VIDRKGVVAMPLKLVWGITGSGDLMPETFATMSAVHEAGDVEITAVLSKAAVLVVRWYKLDDELKTLAKSVLVEKDANSPFIVGKLQIGRYDCLLVSPATANSVAKIAWGIADTIITNAVAQTAKTDVPIYVLPVDQREGTTITTRPGGEKLELKIRRVDIENSRRLMTMEGIEVLTGVDDIPRVLAACRRRQSAGR